MLHLPDARRCRPLRQPSMPLLVLTVILENAPARGRPGDAVDSGFRDVLGKLLQLVRCCLSSQLLEDWKDSPSGRNGRTMSSRTYRLCAIVMTVLVLESKLLNLR